MASLARTLLVAAGALLLGSARCASPGDAEPRVVLVVNFDSLGAGHVSHLGYARKTTPHLDALADVGVAFEDATATAPYALASIPSLLTGRYPDHHGLTAYSRVLPQSERTLAERLSAAGFRTVALSAVNNGGPRFGNEQGFDRFVELYRGAGPEGATTVMHRGELCHLPGPNEALGPLREELDQLGDEQRLFVFVHLLQPHAPYDPLERFLAPLRDERYPVQVHDGEREELRERLREDPLAEEVKEGVRWLYDGNVASADAGLGALLGELKTRGLFDEALIVATGNHGDAFWEHGIAGHGVHLYQEQLHVPLVLKLPASDGAQGLRRGQLVSSMDLVPTLLERLAIPFEVKELDGRSLLPLIASADAPTQHPLLFARSEPKRGAERLIALRRGSEKIIVTLAVDESGAQRAGTIELYDLARDPHETRDLAPEHPAHSAALAQEALLCFERLGAEHED
jgi:arylsulfatase